MLAQERMKRRGLNKHRLVVDVIVISASILLALLFSYFGVFEAIIRASVGFLPLDSFITGLFFTSAFTTALSIVAFGELAQVNGSLFTLSLFGAAGAACGDLIIYYFLNDRLTKDVLSVATRFEGKKIGHLFESRIFRYLTFFAGALLIASPLPDEIGIAMMGLSKAKTWVFLPLSFAFNFLGIFIIGSVARAL